MAKRKSGFQGRIIKNWDQDWDNPENLRKLVGAFNFFMAAPDTDDKLRAALQFMATPQAVQHFTSYGDFPDQVKQVLQKFHLQAAYDEGWRDIFQVTDFTGTTESGFDIMDVSTGLTFRKVPAGDKIDLYKVSGAKVSVGFDTYGGGLSWRRDWFDDEKYWNLEETALEFREKAFLERAQTHYALAELAASSHTISWQNPIPATLPNTNDNYTAIRDMLTINAACEGIITDLKDSGLSVNTATTFKLVAPYQLMFRINRALGLLNMNLAGPAFAGVQYRVEPMYTTLLSYSNKYMVCAPGRKAKSGIRMNLEMMSDFDILTFCQNLAGWQRYGAGIGETKQFRECAIS